MDRSRIDQLKHIQVEIWIARRTEISNGAKLYHGILKWHARKKDRAWPGREKIAAWLGASLRTASRYQAELRKYNLIGIRQRYKRATVCFFVENHPWMREVPKMAHPLRVPKVAHRIIEYSANAQKKKKVKI